MSFLFDIVHRFDQGSLRQLSMLAKRGIDVRYIIHQTVFAGVLPRDMIDTSPESAKFVFAVHACFLDTFYAVLSHILKRVLRP